MRYAMIAQINKLTTIFLFSIFSLAQVNSWASSPTIFGKWERAEKISKELTIEIRLEVTEESSTFEMTCNVEGTKGDVKVKIATKIDGWNFHILEDGYDSKDVNDFDCRIVLNAGVWTYDLSGNRLKLVPDNGGLLFMNRVK